MARTAAGAVPAEAGATVWHLCWRHGDSRKSEGHAYCTAELIRDDVTATFLQWGKSRLLSQHSTVSQRIRMCAFCTHRAFKRYAGRATGRVLCRFLSSRLDLPKHANAGRLGT